MIDSSVPTGMAFFVFDLHLLSISGNSVLLRGQLNYGDIVNPGYSVEFFPPNSHYHIHDFSFKPVMQSHFDFWYLLAQGTYLTDISAPVFLTYNSYYANGQNNMPIYLGTLLELGEPRVCMTSSCYNCAADYYSGAEINDWLIRVTNRFDYYESSTHYVVKINFNISHDPWYDCGSNSSNPYYPCDAHYNSGWTIRTGRIMHQH